MTTLQVPDTTLVIESNGRNWAIWEVVNDELGDPEFNKLIDCGNASTRIGMKIAVLRRIAPLMFDPKYQRHDPNVAWTAGPYAAKDVNNGQVHHYLRSDRDDSGSR